MLAEGRDELVGRAQYWIYNQIKKLDNIIAKLSGEKWTPDSWDLQRLQMILAYKNNLDFVREISEKLPPMVSPLDICIHGHSSGSAHEYLDFSGQLERDWSNQELMRHGFNKLKYRFSKLKND